MAAAAAAANDKLLLSCLRCGEMRVAERTPTSITPAECSACGYLGWTEGAADAWAALRRLAARLSQAAT